jgi:hypothetical protein
MFNNPKTAATGGEFSAQFGLLSSRTARILVWYTRRTRILLDIISWICHAFLGIRAPK